MELAVFFAGWGNFNALPKIIMAEKDGRSKDYVGRAGQTDAAVGQ